MRDGSKIELVVIAVAVAATAVAALLFKRLAARVGDRLIVSLAPEEGSRVEGSARKRRVEIIIDRDPQAPNPQGERMSSP